MVFPWLAPKSVIVVLAGYYAALLPALVNLHKSVRSFLFAAALYLSVVARYLFSGALMMRDTFDYHYPVFQYICEAFKNGVPFTDVFYVSGGVRMGMFHINMFPYAPFRMVGYALHLLTPLSVLTAYKLQHVMGILFSNFGWWLALLEFTGDPVAACFGLLSILLGGCSITLHQEHVAMTFHLMPWLVLCLLKARQDRRWLAPALGLFMLGLSVHYPQIQLISMSLVCLAFGTAWPGVLLNAWRLPRPILLACLVAALAALAPLFYIHGHLPEFSSPLRQGVVLGGCNYSDYMRLNRMQPSSADAGIMLRGSVGPAFPCDPDDASFFVGKAALVAAGCGLIFAFRRAVLIGVLAVLFYLLTLGIHSPLNIPGALFRLHFPFIDLFRQWFHFFPFLSMSVSLLAAIGVAALNTRFKPAGRRWRVLVSVLFFIQAGECVSYGLDFLSAFSRWDRPIPLSTLAFDPENSGPASLLQYRERLYRAGIARSPFPTAPYIMRRSVLRAEPKAAVSVQRGAAEYAVFETSTRGVTVDTQLKQAGNLVVPLNYRLGVTGTLDGMDVPVQSADGAFCSAWAPPGRHRIVLSAVRDSYSWIALLRLAVYACVFIGIYGFF